MQKASVISQVCEKKWSRTYREGSQSTLKLRLLHAFLGSIDELKERETKAKKEQADFNRRLENQKQELEDLRAGISRLGLRKQTLPEKKEQLAEAIRSVKDETHVQRKGTLDIAIFTRLNVSSHVFSATC